MKLFSQAAAVRQSERNNESACDGFLTMGVCLGTTILLTCLLETSSHMRRALDIYFAADPAKKFADLRAEQSLNPMTHHEYLFNCLYMPVATLVVAFSCLLGYLACRDRLQNDGMLFESREAFRAR